MKPNPKPTGKYVAKKPTDLDSPGENQKSSSAKPGAGRTAAAAGRKAKPTSGGIPAQIAGIPTMRIVSAVATILIGAVVVLGVHWYRTVTYNETLQVFSKTMNKALPQKIDDHLRIEETVVGRDEKTGRDYLAYKYAYTDLVARQVNIEKRVKELRAPLIKQYKEQKNMEDLREHNIEIRHKYYDKNGEFIHTIAISPKDF